MPVIKSAKKKLRQDKKREKANKILRNAFRNAIREAQKSKTSEKIIKAVKLVDNAAKKKLIHKNKAARIKSSLSKLVKTSASRAKPVVKTVKKTKSIKVKK